MAERLLLLGAAGTVGSRVALAFLQAGYSVRCLSRSRGARNLALVEAAGGEIVWGDMNDESALAAALEGCRWFVHSAAPFPWSGLKLRLRRYLRDWPAQVRKHFEQAHAAGIERAVFTSSLSTIGLASPGELAHEDLPYDPKRQSGGTYYPVKAALEQAVGALAEQHGVVIVNPTGLVGPGSRNPQLSAACVFFQGMAPAMVDAPINFVDCDHQARGHVLALEKGTPGRRYILGGVNTTLRQFAELVAGMAGRRRPPRVPRALVKLGAYGSELAGLFTGKPGALSLTSYYHLRYGQHYSSERARTELGYEPTTDLEPAVRRELEWYGVPIAHTGADHGLPGGDA